MYNVIYREEVIKHGKRYHELRIENEFTVCPVYGYELDFHSIFKRVGESNDFLWQLICPSCQSIFDTGLSVGINKNIILLNYLC